MSPIEPYSCRALILDRLRNKVSSGQAVIGAGAGTGICAKCEEDGGVDLIVIYNSGRYRMAGRGSLAGLLAYGNANEEMTPLWQNIFGRMRDYHRESNSKQNDLRCVAFIHKRLLDSVFCDDLGKASADLGSHIEGTEFRDKAIELWNRNQPQIEVDVRQR